MQGLVGALLIQSDGQGGHSYHTCSVTLTYCHGEAQGLQPMTKDGFSKQMDPRQDPDGSFRLLGRR